VWGPKWLVAPVSILVERKVNASDGNPNPAPSKSLLYPSIKICDGQALQPGATSEPAGTMLIATKSPFSFQMVGNEPLRCSHKPALQQPSTLHRAGIFFWGDRSLAFPPELLPLGQPFRVCVKIGCACVVARTG
jgi:hypothetical protein